MWKRIMFIVCFLFGACASTTSSLSEMRWTPAEVRSGGSGESQIGSSKLVGTHKGALRRSRESRVLLNSLIRARTYDHSGALTS